MPELIEIEYYRSALDARVGSVVDQYEPLDPDYIRHSAGTADHLQQLVGTTLAATRRHGKVLIAEFASSDNEYTLGMRFGMTGRLLFDGEGPIERLEYSSGRNEQSWDRFALTLNGVRMSVRDPRRLGSVELDPELDQLGPEASTITANGLSTAFQGRRRAIKSALLDQSIIAGLGNLLVDEVLWVAGFNPSRSCADLDDAQIAALASTIRSVVDTLAERGGSHRGDSFDAREVGAYCPRCDEPDQSMRHDTVGGRSTWWCPAHQR